MAAELKTYTCSLCGEVYPVDFIDIISSYGELSPEQLEAICRGEDPDHGILCPDCAAVLESIIPFERSTNQGPATLH